MASDKRSNSLFGTSISLNDANGVIAVGSPKSSVMGFYKDVPSVYPYKDAADYSTASGLHFPVPMSYMEDFQASPTASSASTGSSGIWLLRNLSAVDPNARVWDGGGSVYIFVKDHSVVAASGAVLISQHWYNTEHAKIQAHDENGMDSFGQNVFLSGTTLAVGSPGQDGIRDDDGAVYIYNAAFASLSFAKAEFHVIEGSDLVATVTLNRNLDTYDGAVIVEYATSDITARGIDKYKFDECLGLSPLNRASTGCGDYEQTRGLLNIAPLQNSGGFKIRIMNDLCRERYMKYLQVTISVPGASAVQGENVMAKVRIDDDDFNNLYC